MADEHQTPSDGVAESSPLLGVRPIVDATSRQKNRVVVNLLCLIMFLASSAGGFLSIPQARIVEDVLCQKYYGKEQAVTEPIDEKLCKVEAIQSELASILAFQLSFDSMACFIAAFPWSLVADRIGRKPVLFLSLTGPTLGVLWTMLVLWFHGVFPIRLIWLDAIFQLLGGGNPVLIAMLLSMLTDATNDEERAVVFLRLHVVSMCGNLLAPTLSSLMMEHMGPWPPAWVCVAGLFASLVCILFVPETLKPKEVHGSEDQELPDQKSRLSQLRDRFKDSLSILKSPSLILLLLSCLGSLPIFIGTLTFMAQFVSKRYEIKLYQSGYVQSSYGVAQMIQSLVILPWLSKYVMRDTAPSKLRQSDEHTRDLSLALWSYGITVVAVLVLGLAPTLPFFLFGLFLLALGSGCSSLTRSLMSLYVDPAHRSRLFGLVGMVEIVGAIYAQPMLAGLFSLGMKLGGEWIGLPYYGLALLTAVATALVMFVRVPKTSEDSTAAPAETPS